MAQAETRAPTVPDPSASPSAPTVLVVLVADRGSDSLRQCLIGLSRQTHPRIGVVAVDNASSSGAGDLLVSALGPSRVIRLDHAEHSAGAVSEGLGSPLAEEADYFLFLHDDTVLAPDAVARLVEAAERVPSAGVVGPKVLDWGERRLLVDVGMSTDRFGYPYSPLEDGEIDQGQYDRVREVLFVGTSAMLVSAEALGRIGPPDDRFESGREGLDFCWRARLAGFRVLMTPAAEARQRSGPEAEPSDSEHRDRTRYERERVSLAAVLKNYGLLSLVWVLPVYLALGVCRVLVLALSRRFEDAYQVVAAWGWNVAHLPGTLRKRRRAQAARAVRDREIRRYMAPVTERLRRWAGSARQLLPTRSIEGDEEEVASPAVPLRVRLVGMAMAHPVMVAWTLGALLAAVAYRNLIAASPLAGGALPSFPATPGGFFEEFLSGLKHTGLGGTQQASPALALLGLGSVASFGSAPLFEKVLLLGLPLLVGVAAYRLLRGLTCAKVPAVVGAGCYVLSAVTLWALSEGRLDALVLLAALPWLVRKLLDGFDRELKVTSLRWAAGGGLGIAVVASFFPGALLAALVVTLCALAVPGESGARALGLIRAGSIVAAGALLAFPVTLAVLRNGGAGLQAVFGPTSFGSIARLALVPGAPGSWRLALYLPVAAGLGLVLVSGRGGRTAVWASLTVVVSVYLAWLSSAGYLPAPLSNPIAYVATAGIGYAILVALGLSSVMEGVASAAFGHRQVGVAALALVLAVGLAGQVYQAAAGSWSVGGPDRIPAAEPLVAISGGPPYRLLWLGAWSGDALPYPGGIPDGRVGAGRASVRYAVTWPAGASAFDFGRPSGGPGYGAVYDALRRILSGATRHGGALLAPFGVRFLVGDPEDVPDGVLRRLSAQVDLDRVPADGLVIFSVAGAAPLASTIPSESWAMAAGDPTDVRLASIPQAHASPALPDGSGYAAPAVPPGGFVYVADQHDDRWTARTSDGATIHPDRAFDWAIGFDPGPNGTTGSVSVRYTGQGARDFEVLLLAALWLAALWITRRRSASGR